MIPTKNLDKELKTKNGVEVTTVEPNKELIVDVNGPAIVLMVIN